MLNESNKHLHLMLGNCSSSLFNKLNLTMLRKKFPGEHIALTREVHKHELESTGFFEEIHCVDISYLQRSSFSPILGDEKSFQYFFKCISNLTEQKWTKIFNIQSDRLNSSVSELFESQQIIGAFNVGQQRNCNESSLKLLSLLSTWKMETPYIQSWLAQKSFAQLDWSSIEEQIQTAVNIKNQKTINPLKSIIVAVDPAECLNHSTKLDLLKHLFTVIEISSSDVGQNFIFDFLVVEKINLKKRKTISQITYDMIDTDYLSEVLNDIIGTNLEKWACLSFLFDFLGSPRSALASEKIMARYDRETLKQFLLGQVMNLKSFSRILLDNSTKLTFEQKSTSMETFWNSTAGTITFVSALELSLHSSMNAMIRNESDVQAIKKRMRSLNQFFERLHRASAIELPRTDLGLTL